MNAQTGDVLWTDTTPRGECGAVLDAGSVLLALTSATELVAMLRKAGFERIECYGDYDRRAFAIDSPLFVAHAR